MANAYPTIEYICCKSLTEEYAVCVVLVENLFFVNRWSGVVVSYFPIGFIQFVWFLITFNLFFDDIPSISKR